MDDKKQDELVKDSNNLNIDRDKSESEITDIRQEEAISQLPDVKPLTETLSTLSTLTLLEKEETLEEQPCLYPFLEQSASAPPLESSHEPTCQLPHESSQPAPNFPDSFVDCVRAFVADMPSQLALKPFTTVQLKSFYSSDLVEEHEAILTGFLDSQKDLEGHPLFEALSNYLRCRLQVKLADQEVNDLERDVARLTASSWSEEMELVTGDGECDDGRQVEARLEVLVARWDASSSAGAASKLKQVRQVLSEKVALHVYEAESSRLRVDGLVHQLRFDQWHAPVSILFAFLRRPVQDRPFLDDVRSWLDLSCARLLAQDRLQDYLFLAHHVVRCPPGVVQRWAKQYVQTPRYDPADPGRHVDVLLALLRIVCQPIVQRDDFLKTWNSSEWVYVDSCDSCDSSDDQDRLDGLTEDDILAILNQIPVMNAYRFALLIFERDGAAVVGAASLGADSAASAWWRLVGVCSAILAILQDGLKTYGAQRHRNVVKKLGQWIVHCVCNVCDPWRLYWSPCRSLVDPAMWSRMETECDAFVMRALAILVDNRRLWPFLSQVPFRWMSRRARFESWILMHRILLGDDPVGEGLLMSADWSSNLAAKLSALAEPETFMFLVTLSSLVGDPAAGSLRSMVVWQLVDLGVANDDACSRDACFRTAKDLLAAHVAQDPCVASLILRLLERHLRASARLVEAKALLVLVKDLPLHVWRPTDDDMAILRSWILNPLHSCQHQLAVTILSRLNWEMDG